MTKRTCLGVVLGAMGLLACSELPAVDRGQCGNGVVERDRGEDCDRPGDTCGQPDTAAACRLRCSETVACPTGAVCGGDGVCRGTADTFEVTATTRWTARNLLVGDTTGDGYPELLGVGDATIDVLAGSADATYASATTLTNLTVFDEPRLSDRDHDGLADLTVPVGLGVYSLLGDADAVLDPVLQSSLPVPTAGRFVASAVPIVRTSPGRPPLLDTSLLTVMRTAAPPVAEVVTLGDGAAPIPVGRRAELTAGGTVPWAWLSATELVAAVAFHDDPATGAVDESGVFLYRGNPYTETVTALGQYALPSGLRLRRPPDPGAQVVAWLARIDDDPAADLVLSVTGPFGEGLVVAWGSGLGDFAAPVYLVGGPGPQALSPEAIGFADLDGDGRAELIGPSTIALNDCPRRSPCTLTAISRNRERPWTGVATGDVNGDGRVDLVGFGEQALALEVLLGTPVRGTFNDARIVSPGAIAAARVGDFDGNGVGDVAFVASTGAASDALYVAFGIAGGVPAAPTYTGFIGELIAFDRFSAAVPGRDDAIDDLLVATERGGERGAALLFGSSSQRLIAPLIPAASATDRFNFVQAVLSVPMDADDTADVAALVAELDSGGAAGGSMVTYAARVYQSNPDGSLTERTTQAVTIPSGMFELFGSSWTSIPRQLGTPSLLVGIDVQGRMVAVAVECTAAGCTGSPQAVTTPDPLGQVVHLRALDVDGDGLLDVAGTFRVSRTGVDATVTRVVYWRNDGGRLGAPVEVAGPAGVDLYDVAALDLRLDGTRDLVLLGRSDAAGQGGLYTTPVTGTAAPARYLGALDLVPEVTRGLLLEAADLDRDGLTDLALTHGPDPSSPRGAIVLTQVPALVPAAEEE